MRGRTFWIVVLGCGLLAAAGLCFWTQTNAGTLATVSCDSCGYTSDYLHLGSGLQGVEHTLVYCPACKEYMTLPTKILEPDESNSNAKIAVAQGKEMFLGSECEVYICPRCNGKTYAYSGSACPLCQKGKITQEPIGEWD